MIMPNFRMNLSLTNRNLVKALGFLTLSAFLFSLMGVCIRYASHSVDNPTIVFFPKLYWLIRLSANHVQ